MASPTTTLIRRIVLFGNGLTFLLIAIAVLFAVDKVAYIYGYTLNGVGGHNEFRAVYMGFWVGLTILFFIATWKINQPILGDLALLMVLLQSMGRLLSFVIDGKPPVQYILVFFLELSTSVFGLIMRPQLSTTQANSSSPPGR